MAHKNVSFKLLSIQYIIYKLENIIKYNIINNWESCKLQNCFQNVHGTMFYLQVQ